MIIGVLYGENIDEDSEETTVAAEVYDADQVFYLEALSEEAITKIQEEAEDDTETALIVTNDNLDGMDVLRNLYGNVLQLEFIQSVKNLRKNYAYMFAL